MLKSYSKVMKILILCTGNSCRSQMAHGFLQSFDPNITVCSAGTEASGKLNQNAVKAMAEIGIDIRHHTSDSVEKYLDDEWDYVITVCGGANEACPAFLGLCSGAFFFWAGGLFAAASAFLISFSTSSMDA